MPTGNATNNPEGGSGVVTLHFKLTDRSGSKAPWSLQSGTIAFLAHCHYGRDCTNGTLNKGRSLHPQSAD